PAVTYQPRHLEAGDRGDHHFIGVLDEVDERCRKLARDLVDPPMPDVRIEQDHSSTPQAASGALLRTSPTSLALPASAAGGRRRGFGAGGSSSSSGQKITSTLRCRSSSGIGM